MYIIEAEEQIPYKFYSRLNDYEDASKLEKLNSKSAILPFVTDNEGRIILAQLARNIELIVSKYPENYVKRCRDINYWLNDKIKKYEEKTGQNISSEALTVFNDIKWKKGGKDVNVCQQNPEPYGTKHVDLMKNLDDYFEIRDNNGCNALKNKNECLKYNEYIRERKEYFSSEINHKCSTPVCNRNNYKINDYCSLNNIDDTFPEINCEVLYKKEFTPVGSIIHRYKRRKYDFKKIIEKVDDDRYSSYHSDTIPADSENKRYYIEYSRPHN
ncbi:unnamed protein product [Plasmodium vivax]|uniref:(malaria parasite P. vivax) hypothetical protein n=1 Tax=Plasmodium vivax TaxID=5855 RepID=A0A8S4HPS0_PLAVI|nr:unnamed protein product [Plasmodium vivax]